MSFISHRLYDGPLSASSPSTKNANPPAERASPPPYTAAQAIQDANALYQASQGGFTGWGTDKDAIWQVFEHRTKAEIDGLLEQSYKALPGGHSLKPMLDDEFRHLEGLNKERFEAYWEGGRAYSDGIVRNAKAEAIGLHRQVNGWGQQTAINLLSDMPADFRVDVVKAYAMQFDQGGANGSADHRQNPRDFLLNDFQRTGYSDQSMARIEALLPQANASADQIAQNQAKADAMRLHVARGGFLGLGIFDGDVDTIRQVLQQGQSETLPAYRQRLQQTQTQYQAEYGEALTRQIAHLNPIEQEEIRHLLDPPAAEAGPEQQRQWQAKTHALRLKKIFTEGKERQARQFNPHNTNEAKLALDESSKAQVQYLLLDQSALEDIQAIKAAYLGVAGTSLEAELKQLQASPFRQLMIEALDVEPQVELIQEIQPYMVEIQTAVADPSLSVLARKQKLDGIQDRFDQARQKQGLPPRSIEHISDQLTQAHDAYQDRLDLWKLKGAVNGLGTNEDLIFQVIGTKNRAQLDRLSALYAQHTQGENLQTRLQDELRDLKSDSRGSEYVRLLFQQKPIESQDKQTPLQVKAERLLTRQAYEQSHGGTQSPVQDFLHWVNQDDYYLSEGIRLDATLQATLDKLNSGKLDEAGLLEAEQSLMQADASLQGVVDAKSAIVDYAAMGSVMVLTTAASIATGGSFTPAQLTILSALSGSLAATSAYVVDPGQSGADLANQFWIGGLGVGSSALFPGTVRPGATWLGNQAAKVAPPTRAPVLSVKPSPGPMRLGQSIDLNAEIGAIMSSADYRTWENGWEEGFKRVGIGALFGGALGGAFHGAAMGLQKATNRLQATSSSARQTSLSDANVEAPAPKGLVDVEAYFARAQVSDGQERVGPQRSQPADSRTPAKDGDHVPSELAKGDDSSAMARVVTHLDHLIAIRSPHTESNRNLIAYIYRALQGHGFAFEARIHHDAPGEPDKVLLCARRQPKKGEAKSRSFGLVFNTDTVLPTAGQERLRLQVENNGEMTGLGVSNKAAIAVALELAQQTDAPFDCFFTFNLHGGLTAAEVFPDVQWSEYMLVYGPTGFVPMREGIGYATYAQKFPTAESALHFMCRLDDLVRYAEYPGVRPASAQLPSRVNYVFANGGFSATQVPSEASMVICLTLAVDSTSGMDLIHQAIHGAKSELGDALHFRHDTSLDGVELQVTSAGGHPSEGNAQSALRALAIVWSHLEKLRHQRGLPRGVFVPLISSDKLEMLLQLRSWPSELDALRKLVEKTHNAGGHRAGTLTDQGHDPGFNTPPEDPLVVAAERASGLSAQATLLGSEAGPLARNGSSTVLFGFGQAGEQSIHRADLRKYLRQLRHLLLTLEPPELGLRSRHSPPLFPASPTGAGMPSFPVLVIGEDALAAAQKNYPRAQMIVALSFGNPPGTDVFDKLFSRTYLLYDLPKFIRIFDLPADQRLSRWWQTMPPWIRDIRSVDDMVQTTAQKLQRIIPSARAENRDEIAVAPFEILLKAGGSIPQNWQRVQSGNVLYFLPELPKERIAEVVAWLRRSSVTLVFNQPEWLPYLLIKNRVSRGSWSVLGEDLPVYQAALDLAESLREASPSTPLHLEMLYNAFLNPSLKDSQKWVGIWRYAEDGEAGQLIYFDGSKASIEQADGRTQVTVHLQGEERAERALSLDALLDFLDRQNIVPQAFEISFLRRIDSGAGAKDLTPQDMETLFGFHQIDARYSAGQTHRKQPSKYAFEVPKVHDVYGDGTAMHTGAEEGVAENVVAWGFHKPEASGTLDVLVNPLDGSMWSGPQTSAVLQMALAMRNKGFNAQQLRIGTAGHGLMPILYVLSEAGRLVPSSSLRHALDVYEIPVMNGPVDTLLNPLFHPHFVGTPPIRHASSAVAIGADRIDVRLGGQIVSTAYDPWLRDSLAAVLEPAQRRGVPQLIMGSLDAHPDRIAEYLAAKGADTRHTHMIYVPRGFQLPGVSFATQAVPIPRSGNDLWIKRILGQILARRMGWMDDTTAVWLSDDDAFMRDSQLNAALQALRSPRIKVAGWQFEGGAAGKDSALADLSNLMHWVSVFRKKKSYLGEGSLLVRGDDIFSFVDMYSEGWLPFHIKTASGEIVSMGPMHQKPEEPLIGFQPHAAEAFSDTLIEAAGQWIGRIPNDALTREVLWAIAAAQRRGLIDDTERRLRQLSSDRRLEQALIAPGLPLAQRPSGAALRQEGLWQLAEERRVLDHREWPALMSDLMVAFFQDLETVPGLIDALVHHPADSLEAFEDFLGLSFYTGGGLTRPTQ